MPESPGPETGVSALDRAHGMRVAGDHTSALRVALAILDGSASDVGAAYLVARSLWDTQRSATVALVARELVVRFMRRGDLGGAVVSAQLAGEAGEDSITAINQIARAFGSGSARVGEGAGLPPPLPSPVNLRAWHGEALFSAAEEALKRFSAQPDSVPDDTPLPRLPLFGALAAPILKKLLEGLTLHEYGAGATLVRQGDEGLEAFLLVRGVLNVVHEDGSGQSTVLAVLGPGAVFGEMALVSRAPRGASVFSVEPVQVLAVSKARIESLAMREPLVGSELARFTQQRLLANLIQHSRIFSLVEPAKRHELVTRFSSHTFQPGDHLLRQGGEGGNLFLIASGLVDIRSTDADGDCVVLTQLGPGDVVGEISLVLRKPAVADVVAVHTTVALELTWEAFHDAIREHPGLLQQLYETATQREAETRRVTGRPVGPGQSTHGPDERAVRDVMDAMDVSDIVLL